MKRFTSRPVVAAFVRLSHSDRQIDKMMYYWPCAEQGTFCVRRAVTGIRWFRISDDVFDIEVVLICMYSCSYFTD